MVRTHQLIRWLVIVSLLAAVVSTTAGGSQQVRSGEALPVAQTAVAGKRTAETTIIDVVPLQTPVATQFVLGPANELQVCYYEPPRLAISEVKRGKIIDDVTLTALRSRLDGSSSQRLADGGGQNRELVEDDQYRLLVCNPLQGCQSMAGGLANASSALREVIELLKTLAGAMPVVNEAAWYLRCVPVPDKQWASIERRGT